METLRITKKHECEILIYQVIVTFIVIFVFSFLLFCLILEPDGKTIQVIIWLGVSVLCVLVTLLWFAFRTFGAFGDASLQYNEYSIYYVLKSLIFGTRRTEIKIKNIEKIYRVKKANSFHYRWRIKYRISIYSNITKCLRFPDKKYIRNLNNFILNFSSSHHIPIEKIVEIDDNNTPGWLAC